MPAVAAVNDAMTETSREVVPLVTTPAPRNPSKAREPEMHESMNSLRKTPGLRQSDAIAGAFEDGETRLITEVST